MKTQKEVMDRIEILKVKLQGREPDHGFGVYIRELSYLEGLVSK